MLSEILMAAAPIKRESKADRRPGLSVSQLFPCPYRLRRVHEGTFWGEDITPQQYYNMADGWDQEEQSVRRLTRAGVKIFNRQGKVLLGRSRVPGSYDGECEISGVRFLWEHKAYDAYSEAVQFFKYWGMDKLPSQRAQTNGYMLGANLEWTDFFIKLKNNNDYMDVTYKIDRPFIEEIVEWCDKIILDNWKPEPKQCKWCTLCNLDCFGTLVDFSWIGEASSEEMEDKWLKGDLMEKAGSSMKEEARAYFVGSSDKHGNILVKGIIGDQDLLQLNRIDIRKIIQHRLDISRGKILQEFGPEGLLKVSEEKEIVQYRFRTKEG